MAAVLGLDVSSENWSRGIPYRLLPRMHRAGIRFLMARASLGTVADPAFDDNRVKAFKRGWTPGAYHFMKADDPVGQAEAFAKRINATGGPDNLLIAVDLEAGTDSYADVRTFMERLRTLVRRHPIGLYTNQSTWVRLDNHDATNLFDWLWQARWLLYHQKPPLEVPDFPPRGLGGLPTLMWQPGPYEFAGHRLDGDAFYGSADDLKMLASQRDRVPLPERPAYRKGYNAMILSAQIAISGATVADGFPAFRAGVQAAREDAIQAVRELILVP